MEALLEGHFLRIECFSASMRTGLMHITSCAFTSFQSKFCFHIEREDPLRGVKTAGELPEEGISNVASSANQSR